MLNKQPETQEFQPVQDYVATVVETGNQRGVRVKLAGLLGATGILLGGVGFVGGAEKVEEPTSINVEGAPCSPQDGDEDGRCDTPTTFDDKGQSTTTTTEIITTTSSTPETTVTTRPSTTTSSTPTTIVTTTSSTPGTTVTTVPRQPNQPNQPQPPVETAPPSSVPAVNSK